jgi:hypothetical protein
MWADEFRWMASGFIKACEERRKKPWRNKAEVFIQLVVAPS